LGEDVKAGKRILLLERNYEDGSENRRYLFRLLVELIGYISVCNLRLKEAFDQGTEHFIGQELGVKGEGDNHQKFPSLRGGFKSVSSYQETVFGERPQGCFYLLTTDNCQLITDGKTTHQTFGEYKQDIVGGYL
jgi:hypothetical protein